MRPDFINASSIKPASLLTAVAFLTTACAGNPPPLVALKDVAELDTRTCLKVTTRLFTTESEKGKKEPEIVASVIRNTEFIEACAEHQREIAITQAKAHIRVAKIKAATELLSIKFATNAVSPQEKEKDLNRILVNLASEDPTTRKEQEIALAGQGLGIADLLRLKMNLLAERYFSKDRAVLEATVQEIIALHKGLRNLNIPPAKQAQIVDEALKAKKLTITDIEAMYEKLKPGNKLTICDKPVVGSDGIARFGCKLSQLEGEQTMTLLLPAKVAKEAGLIPSLG